MRILFLILIFPLTLLGLTGPYIADEYTLHLYHFDGNCDDSVNANPIDLALNNGATVVDPLGFADFGNCLNTYTLNTTSTARPVAAAANGISAGNFTGTDGSFTFEAIVKVNAGAASHGNMQLICGEGDSDSARGWQFRISSTNRLEFINLYLLSSYSFALPASGVHAFALDKWFHVAVSYNGSDNTAGNLKFYWTALGTDASEAVLLGQASMAADIPQDRLVDFTIGNEGRDNGGYTENFQGFIDEVRISSVARDPEDMLSVVDDELAVIISEPEDMVVKDGEEVIFNLTFSSQSDPQVYWYRSKGSLYVPVEISDIVRTCQMFDPETGLYSAELIISDVSRAFTGMYFAVIHNDSEHEAASAPSELTVLSLVSRWTMDLDDYLEGYYMDIAGGYNAAITGQANFASGISMLENSAAIMSGNQGCGRVADYPLITAQGQFSIAFWVDSSVFSYNTEELYLSKTEPGSYVSISDVIDAQQGFNHIAITSNGSIVTVYFNGEVLSESNWIVPEDLTGTLTFGGLNSGPDTFTFAIDDIKIFNYPLSRDDIQTMYLWPNGKCRYCVEDLAGFAASWLSDGLYP